MSDSQDLKGISSFVREKDGKVSSSRLLFLIWGVGIFLTWAYISYQTKNLQPIPESVVTILGILAGTKAVQRFGENS